MTAREWNQDDPEPPRDFTLTDADGDLLVCHRGDWGYSLIVGLVHGPEDFNGFRWEDLTVELHVAWPVRAEV